MSIRPVDFNGMIQNTQSPASEKAAQDQQPNIAQQNLTTLSQEESYVSTTQVHESENTAQEGAVDPDQDNGQAAYSGNGRRRKKQTTKEETSDGKVIKKGSFSSFDISI